MTKFTNILNTRILLSGATILAAAALIVGATFAFFSDSETSTGNVLAAGDIDLRIDNTSYVTNSSGILVESPATSWTLRDLTVEKFFNFTDIKPGDIGEDTISIHVGSNNAWVCAAARVIVDSDETCTDPEQTDETGACIVETDGTNGELGDQINFSFWKDDGDNVLEVGETPFLSGPISGLNGSGTIALADTSVNSVFGQNVPATGGTTSYIGKAWCFGTLVATPLAQDGVNTDGPIAPNRVGTGFTCDGSALGNSAQTDKVVGDLQFYAVQSRNNASFTCAQGYTPVWPEGVQGPTVGAALGAYTQPEGEACNVNVPAQFATIQGAIDDAGTTNGETVCVAAGTYNEDVNINKSITLAGAGATTSLINGQTAGEAGALVINADNVTVKGFGITEFAGGAAAIRVSGAHSGITINSNKATSGGNNAFLSDGGLSNTTLSNNEFVGNSAQPIVYVNGLASVNVASTNVDFLNNTFSGTGTQALGQEAGASDVKLNRFSAVTSFTDVEDWEGGNLYNQNNFNDAGLNLQHSENGQTGDNGTTNAENNWWGDNNPADGDTSADVDFTPFAASAFAQN